MTWIKFIPPEHECVLPDINSVGIGSIWECDQCKAQHVLTRYRVVAGIQTELSETFWLKFYGSDSPTITIPDVDSSAMSYPI